MKKIIISAACLAMALASCNQIETPENDYQATPLNINVKTAVETKGLITSTSLPDASSLGISVTDESGVTYDGQTITNVKYTASGSGSTQKWSAESDIMLSTTKGTVSAYYPYSENVTDIKAIPVQATSDVQTDFMWATPIPGYYNKNNTAQITMNHALAAVRLKVKHGYNEGAIEVTSVAFSSEGAATEALLDATNGTLSSFNGTGTQFAANETFTTSTTAKSFEFITVPTGISAPMFVELMVNGSKLTAFSKATLLEPGYVYEYDVIVTGTTGISIQGVSVSPWQSVQNGSVAFYEEIEFNFDGTIPEPFEQWAAIQHKDGSLYSPEKWKAFETAGLVTDADANGVVVLYSKYAVCPHVIHPFGSPDSPVVGSDVFGEKKWSSSNVTVPNVTIATTAAEARLDVNGKANTEAILAAVADGTIADAPAAQYCAGITFANGQQGYLPAAGEVQAWYDNKDRVDACLDAIGGDTRMNTRMVWSSTQWNRGEYAYRPDLAYGNLGPDNKFRSSYARPITSFSF